MLKPPVGVFYSTASFETPATKVRALRAQLEETDNQLEEAERRAKVVVARAFNGGNSDGGNGGGGGGILRAEEGLFHDLQAARDELSALKAVRRELEGQASLHVLFFGGGTGEYPPALHSQMRITQ